MALEGDEYMVSNKQTKNQKDSESNETKDSFDMSYSNKILKHLENVNMDPWYYIYSNYVNPTSNKSNSKNNA